MLANGLVTHKDARITMMLTTGGYQTLKCVIQSFILNNKYYIVNKIFYLIVFWFEEYAQKDRLQ